MQYRDLGQRYGPARVGTEDVNNDKSSPNHQSDGIASARTGIIALAALATLLTPACRSKTSQTGSQDRLTPDGAHGPVLPPPLSFAEQYLAVDGSIPINTVIDSLGTRMVQTRDELAGDPSFGTIHFVRDLHPLRADSTNFANRILEAHYQAAILEHLLSKHANVVFVEYPPESPDGSMSPISAKGAAIIQEIFPGGRIPQKLTAEQIEFLSDATASALPRSLQGLRPDIKLYGADNDSVLAVLGNPNITIDNVERDRLTFPVRESTALRRVYDYLRRHNGEEVYVIFGASHRFNFDDLPRGGPIPRITSTTFPGLLAMYPDSQDSVSAQLDPKLREKYQAKLRTALEGLLP